MLDVLYYYYESINSDQALVSCVIITVDVVAGTAAVIISTEGRGFCPLAIHFLNIALQCNVQQKLSHKHLTTFDTLYKHVHNIYTMYMETN